MYSYRGLGAAGSVSSRTGGIIGTGGPAGGGVLGDSAGNQLREQQSDSGVVFTATDPNRTGGIAPVEPPTPPVNCPSPYITLMGQCVLPPPPPPPPPPPSGGSGSSSSSSSSSSATPPATDWFTESMFGGIPNWILLAGVGVGALMLSVSGGKHGR